MNIAILGAGVAGVSSAIALKQKGFDVSIYERHDSASNIGAGIIVWPNAAYVLEQLGMLNEIEAVAGRPRAMRRLTSTGEQLGTIDIGLINRDMGYESLSVLRRDFQDVLMKRLESLGIAIHYSHAVTGIKSFPTDQAQVEFQNGKKITADVIVGADGRMASYARQYVKGNNAPIYQGFINWIGVFESETEAFTQIDVADYWGMGERFGIVPVTEYTAYWAGGIASTGIGARVPHEYKAELAAIFSEWPEPVQKMIDRTPARRINKIYVHDHDPLQTWHKHNLVVIGDAAHAPLPTSGQGACQALEDAWHLANCLVDSPGDLPRAFARFTQLRLEKTSKIIMAGRGLASSIFNRDEAYCSARNEDSRNTDFGKVAIAMSRGWAQNLPIGN